MSRTTRFAFVLVLAFLLLAPPSWAGSPQARQSPDALTQVWSLLTGLWADAGCIVDPNGCSALPQSDEGCAIDPHGCSPRPAPAVVPNADGGCIIDPHGCLPKG